MRFISSLGTLILLCPLVVFSLANWQPVSLSLWPSALILTMPAAVALLSVLFVGLFAGGLIVLLGTLRLRFENRRLRSALRRAQEDAPMREILPPEPSAFSSLRSSFLPRRLK